MPKETRVECIARIRKMGWRKDFPKPFGAIPWSYWLGRWGIMSPWGNYEPLRPLMNRYRLWCIPVEARRKSKRRQKQA